MTVTCDSRLLIKPHNDKVIMVVVVVSKLRAFFPFYLVTNTNQFVSIAESEYVLGLGFRKNVFITPPKDLLHLYAFNPQSGESQVHF